MAIRGVLFDKDGTLLDYFATWMPVNHRIVQMAAGGDQDLAARLLCLGGYDAATDRVRSGSPLAAANTYEIASLFAEHAPRYGVDELVREFDRMFLEGGQQGAVAVAGLNAALRCLKDRGLCLGVATSDSEAGAYGSLERFGVVEMLDFVAGYDSGHGVKPGPGMVEAFCATTGLLAADVAVVGDNLHDMSMGQAAGAGLLVGVLTGTSLRHDLEPPADHVLDSVVDLAGLLDRLA